MDADYYQELLAINQGRAKPTWAFLAAAIEENRGLTSQGKELTRWAFSEFEDFFGTDWPGKMTGPGKYLPFMDPGFLDIRNTARHVSVRVLDLALHLSLLKEKKGWKIVQKRIQGSGDYWDAFMMQVELGGLALSNGWEVEFETGLRLGKRSDVTLIGGGHRVDVEAKIFRLPQDLVEALGSGADFNLPINEMGRLILGLASKSTQTQDANSAWIYVHNNLLLYNLGPEQKHSMATVLSEELVKYPHIAGLIISEQPELEIRPKRGKKWTLSRPNAVGMDVTLWPPFHRETLFVSSQQEGGRVQMETFGDWFSHEPDWIYWALSKKGKPVLKEILEPELSQREV